MSISLQFRIANYQVVLAKEGYLNFSKFTDFVDKLPQQDRTHFQALIEIELDAIFGGDPTSTVKSTVDVSVAHVPVESGPSQEEEILDKDVEGEEDSEAEDDLEVKDACSQELFSTPEEASQSQLSELREAQTREEAPEVWSLISEVLKEQHSDAGTTEPKPPKKKIYLLLVASDSDDENEHASVRTALDRYRAEPFISMDTCMFPGMVVERASGQQQEINNLVQRKIAVDEENALLKNEFSNLQQKFKDKSQELKDTKECAQKKEEQNRLVIKNLEEENEGLNTRCTDLLNDLEKLRKQEAQWRIEKSGVDAKIKPFQSQRISQCCHADPLPLLQRLLSLFPPNPKSNVVKMVPDGSRKKGQPGGSTHCTCPKSWLCNSHWPGTAANGGCGGGACRLRPVAAGRGHATASGSYWT
ncbi:Centlein [Chelonia mydas]|uniref:Centlein n=1 Tax=Chelonia mydas TaxID=8469 RepID=M7C0Z7_CHEMY|nr:Centlein [Chelonia mydas]